MSTDKSIPKEKKGRGFNPDTDDHNNEDKEARYDRIEEEAETKGTHQKCNPFIP